MNKIPTMIIYWADTEIPLTHQERKFLEFNGSIVSLTPLEVLLEVKTSKKESRMVVVRGVTDPLAPKVPEPI